MLVPVHFELSFQALQFEQALFLVVLATDCFFRLISRPNVQTALLYGCCLTLCVYTARYSFLPALGYLVFLLRFVNRAQERRAIWYALGATAVPVLLFLPYGLWAHSYQDPNWLTDAPAAATAPVYLRALRSWATERWASYCLDLLFTMALLAGTWISFRFITGSITKRIRLFVLSGGVVSAILAGLALDFSIGWRFNSSHLLWTTPALVILSFAALEFVAKQTRFRTLAQAAALSVIAVCAIADVQYLWPPAASEPREDLQSLAALVPAQLSGDACVVFVSERLSRQLFLLFEPQLDKRECLNFFHSRIVLASHPYVTPEQQHDAESYFHGLNFAESKRLRAGGGQIVVMQQPTP